MITSPVVWFIIVLPCTFRPRPLNLEPLRFVFVSTLHLQCWNHTASIRFGRWIQQFFLGNTKPVPHFKANSRKTFTKDYSRTFTLEQFHWSIQLCKKRCNTLQGFGAFFFQSLDWVLNQLRIAYSFKFRWKRNEPLHPAEKILLQ